MRVLDVGPEADDKAAVQAFRAFWGDKAELRRFKVRVCGYCNEPHGNASLLNACWLHMHNWLYVYVYIFVCVQQMFFPRVTILCMRARAVLYVLMLHQDGRICEAVVWHLPQGSRHAIPDAIVRHVVQRHMPGASIVTHADALDSVLLNPELPSEHVAAARQLLDGAFDRLRKGLMAYVWGCACMMCADVKTVHGMHVVVCVFVRTS